MRFDEFETKLRQIVQGCDLIRQARSQVQKPQDLELVDLLQANLEKDFAGLYAQWLQSTYSPVDGRVTKHGTILAASKTS